MEWYGSVILVPVLETRDSVLLKMSQHSPALLNVDMYPVMSSGIPVASSGESRLWNLLLDMAVPSTGC